MGIFSKKLMIKIAATIASLVCASIVEQGVSYALDHVTSKRALASAATDTVESAETIETVDATV